MLCMHNIYKTTLHHQRMQAQRIKYLQDEIENFPDDPFNHYALALEYISAGDLRAEEIFRHLLKEFPDYLPTYYKAANYFFDRDLWDEAEAIFIKGIALAEAQGNEKAHRELNSSYALFKTETQDDF